MELSDGTVLTPFGFPCLALGSSLVAGLAAALLRAPARRSGFVSRSRRDRFGSGRIPLVGGPALLLGLAAMLLVLRARPPGALAIAAAGMFAVGLWDDLRHPRPAPKFALQALVALVAAAFAAPTPLLFGLYFLLLLLLVNASNYIDNMDGLLAGVALTQAVALLLFSSVAGFGPALLVGVLPALLLATAPPARVYLGDSGSHLIGALLWADAVRHLADTRAFYPRLLLPLALLFAVPLLDVATVTVSRLRRGRPIFRGGTDHLSHRLVRLGFSPPRAVLVLVLASAACGLASLLLLHA